MSQWTPEQRESQRLKLQAYYEEHPDLTAHLRQKMQELHETERGAALRTLLRVKGLARYERLAPLAEAGKLTPVELAVAQGQGLLPQPTIPPEEEETIPTPQQPTKRARTRRTAAEKAQPPATKTRKRTNPRLTTTTAVQRVEG